MEDVRATAPLPFIHIVLSTTSPTPKTHTNTAPLCAKRFSPHLSALILRMLDKRRELRPTMEEVLAHPVFAHYPHFPPEAFSAASSAVALQPPPPSYAYQPQQPLSPPGAVDYAQARAAAYGSGATGAGEVVTTSAAKEAEAKADEKRQQRELAALMRAQRAAQLHQHQQQQQQLHSGGGVGGHGTAASAPVALPLGPGSVVAAAGEQTVVDVDDIIQPVLPDLALQVRGPSRMASPPYTLRDHSAIERSPNQ